jgi:hypothetical protein
MECFNCFTHDGRSLSRNTEAWLKLGKLTFCSNACLQAHESDKVEKEIQKLAEYKDYDEEEMSPTLRRVVKVETIFLKAILRRSKKEQLKKLKTMLEEAYVGDMETMEELHTQGDYLNMCNGMKRLHAKFDMWIQIFAS